MDPKIEDAARLLRDAAVLREGLRSGWREYPALASPLQVYPRPAPQTAKVALSLTCRHLAEYLAEDEAFWLRASWRAVELEIDRLDRNISRWAEAA